MTSSGVSFEIPKDGGHAFVELVPTAFGGSVPKCGLCGKRKRKRRFMKRTCSENPNAAGETTTTKGSEQ